MEALSSKTPHCTKDHGQTWRHCHTKLHTALRAMAKHGGIVIQNSTLHWELWPNMEALSSKTPHSTESYGQTWRHWHPKLHTALRAMAKHRGIVIQNSTLHWELWPNIEALSSKTPLCTKDHGQTWRHCLPKLHTALRVMVKHGGIVIQNSTLHWEPWPNMEALSSKTPHCTKDHGQTWRHCHPKLHTALRAMAKHRGIVF